MSDPTTLRAQGLDKHYGNLHVTRNLDLQVQVGQVHALIGPNGAGKTTALAQLCGELVSDAGTVHLDDRNITGVDLPGRARLGIVRSWQISAPFPNFAVGENVVLAALAAKHRGFGFRGRARQDPARNERARHLLAEVGLDADPTMPVTELDHGGQRLLELAMVLATDPVILLLDEPMAGLAPGEVEHVSTLLARLRADYAILLVEHDMDVVFALADGITVLADGATLASGPPEAIRTEEQVRSLYLQEDV